MGRIFISFANQDNAIASRLCSILEEKGRECWIAPRNIVPGQDYARLITRAVREADAFIIILSESSYRSAHVLNELSLAFDQKLNIIPYCIDSSKPEDAFSYYLATKHRIESGGDLEKDVKSIIDALDHQRNSIAQRRDGGKRTWIWCVAAALALCVSVTFAIKRPPLAKDVQIIEKDQSEVIVPNTEETAASNVQRDDGVNVNEESVLKLQPEKSSGTPRESGKVSVKTPRAEDGFEASLTIQPSKTSRDISTLKEVENGLFLSDAGRYVSDNVRSQSYFTIQGDELLPLVDVSHLIPSVKTILTCAEAGDGIMMKITQHKYGFKTDVYEKPLGVVIASCVADGCRPYVGIDSSDSSSVIASLFMVNVSEGYTHVFKVLIPSEVISMKRGTISADLNAYSPITDSSSMFQDS